MNEKNAVIFANGTIRYPELVRELAVTADLLIAADGGLHHLFELNLIPQLLIGDLDSVTGAQVALAVQNGCEVRRFPEEKDETDLELALLAAATAGHRRIMVVAALGGRLDQTLSNIHLLNLPQLAGLDVRLEDGEVEVRLLRRTKVITGQPGDMVSLLPLSPVVNGITTTGLKYPLERERLEFARSRGISNVMLTDHATVEVSSGVLLCVHTRGKV